MRDAHHRPLQKAAHGGTSLVRGAVYKLDPSGTETILHNFELGADGGNPDGRLYVNPQGAVFGTAFEGGAHAGNGIVFKITQ